MRKFASVITFIQWSLMNHLLYKTKTKPEGFLEDM